jgi:hypothetical protein
MKVADGPERFTVADIDGLLYLPGHRPDQLQRALRIPALAAGWRASFEALAAQEAGNDQGLGNAGLSSAAHYPPAWAGFRPLRVTQIDRESAAVVSLTLARSPIACRAAGSIPGLAATASSRRSGSPAQLFDVGST